MSCTDSMKNIPVHSKKQRVAHIPLQASSTYHQQHVSRGSDQRDRRSVQCFYWRKLGHMKRERKSWAAGPRENFPESNSSRDWLTGRRACIVCFTGTVVHTVKFKVGNLLLTALFDIGSVTSFISAEYFSPLQLSDPHLRLCTNDISCSSASEQTLQLLGYVIVFLKMVTFSWKFQLLVISIYYHLESCTQILQIRRKLFWILVRVALISSLNLRSFFLRPPLLWKIYFDSLVRHMLRPC